MGAKAVSDATKWQIIAYNKLNYSLSQIASLCKVSVCCVTTTIQNYTKTGSIKHSPRSGRPRCSTPREDRDLLRMSRIHPEWSGRKLAAEWSNKSFSEEDEEVISRQTVTRRLSEFGIENYVKAEKPLLTEENRRKRYEWCLERKNWSIDKWAQMINSDESNFQLVNRKGVQRVWRFKNEKYLPQFVKSRVQAGGGSICVWGCIAHSGAGVCKTYSGKMNSVLYIDTLENELKASVDLLMDGSEDWYFQQDNAPCHKSRVVTSYFDTNQIKVMPWPARSPDLSPIEHIWTMIDQKLTGQTISNLLELEVAVVKAWNEIEPSTCANLIESMPRRVELCIKARGGHFNY